jgi:hypothetical protein
MYCNGCGAELADSQSFCSSCGRSTRPVHLMPVESRLAGHIRLLAIFWFALSAFRLIPGMFLIMFFGSRSNFLGPDVPVFVPAILQAVGVLMIVVAALGLMVGWGLLERRPWARMLAIVLACLSLMDMPFGTAVGIYTLWLLLPAKSEEDYRRMVSNA